MSTIVEHRQSVTYTPETKVPVDEWLRPQARFAHLFTPDGAELRAEVQRRVDDEWEAVLACCATPVHPAIESRR